MSDLDVVRMLLTQERSKWGETLKPYSSDPEKCNRLWKLAEQASDLKNNPLVKEEVQKNNRVDLGPDFSLHYKFEDVDRLGGGGLGEVFRAKDQYDRIIAVKRMHDKTNAVREVFISSMKAVAQVKHDHIVQIYAVGSYDGRPCVAMEYMAGGSLEKPAKALREGMTSRLEYLRWVATTVLGLTNALAHLHGKNIIHRDLKPSNVLLTEDRGAKIADFDTVQTLGGAMAPGGGTRRYMAPEQRKSQEGKEVGKPADIYGLGGVLHFLLTGREPFSESDDSVNPETSDTDPTPLRTDRRTDEADLDLDAICAMCLEEMPEKRYASAELLAEDLQKFLDDKPVAARPTPWPSRALKWARRNRREVRYGVAAIILLLICALVVGWITASRAEARRDREKVLALLQVNSLRDSGNLADALARVREALRRDPENLKLIHLGAELEAAVGDPLEALALLDRMESTRESRMLRAKVQMKLQQFEKAVNGLGEDYVAATNSLHRLAARNTDKTPVTAGELSAVAASAKPELDLLAVRNEALAGCRGDQVLAGRREAEALRKGLVEEMIRRSRLMGQLDRLNSLAALRGHFPNEYALYEETARQHNGRDLNAFRHILQEAMARFPNDPRPYRQLAEGLEAVGLWRDAEEAWSGAVRYSGSSEDRFRRARACVELGDFERALPDAMSVAPLGASPERRLLLARTLFHPDRDSALLGLRWFTIQSLTPWLTVAKVRWVGTAGEAFEILKTLRAADPRDADVRLALGDLFWAVGQWNAAATEYQEAANLGRTSEGRLGLAHCELMKGNTEPAARSLRAILDRDKTRLDVALGLYVLPLKPQPGTWIDTLFRMEGVFADTKDEGIQLLRETFAARNGAGVAVWPSTGPLPRPTAEVQRLVDELDPNNTPSGEVFRTLDSRGLEALAALRASRGAAGRPQREMASMFRRRVLREPIDALASKVIQSHLAHPRDDTVFTRHIDDGNGELLAECFLGLIQDPDRPLWIRGLAVMSAAAIADRFPDVRRIIIEAHDSAEPILYRHAVLALSKIKGEDALASLLRGISREDGRYRNLLRGILFDKEAELPPTTLASRYAEQYKDGEQRFLSLSGGRLPDLVVDYPEPQDLSLFDSIIYRRDDVTVLHRQLKRDDLSEHEKWLLCLILQRWPHPDLIPVARRLITDKADRVRVEAAGLLIACGQTEEAFPVLEAVARSAPDRWPHPAGRVIWTSRPWTPSLWLTTLRVAQPGPLGHRALLLLGDIRTVSSLTVLLDVLDRSLDLARTNTLDRKHLYSRTNALAALCQLAADAELAKELNTHFDRLAPLYVDDNDRRDHGNLCLLAGLLGRKDEKVVRFLETVGRRVSATVDGADVFASINAHWALSRIGHQGAEDEHRKRVAAWIGEAGVHPSVRSLWLAAHLTEVGLDLDKAGKLLATVRQARTETGNTLPPVGLIATQVEWEIARNRKTEAARVLKGLLSRSVLAERPRFESFRRWLEGEVGTEPHVSARWQLANVAYEWGWTQHAFEPSGRR